MKSIVLIILIVFTDQTVNRVQYPMNDMRDCLITELLMKNIKTISKEYVMTQYCPDSTSNIASKNRNACLQEKPIKDLLFYCEEK